MTFTSNTSWLPDYLNYLQKKCIATSVFRIYFMYHEKERQIICGTMRTRHVYCWSVIRDCFSMRHAPMMNTTEETIVQLAPALGCDGGETRSRVPFNLLLEGWDPIYGNQQSACFHCIRFRLMVLDNERSECNEETCPDNNTIFKPLSTSNYTDTTDIYSSCHE